jgi:hypothetical protein
VLFFFFIATERFSRFFLKFLFVFCHLLRHLGRRMSYRIFQLERRSKTLRRTKCGANHCSKFFSLLSCASHPTTAHRMVWDFGRLCVCSFFPKRNCAPLDTQPPTAHRMVWDFGRLCVCSFFPNGSCAPLDTQPPTAHRMVWDFGRLCVCSFSERGKTPFTAVCPKTVCDPPLPT